MTDYSDSNQSIIITSVEKGSIGYNLSIEPQDKLLYINDEPVQDFLQYMKLVLSLCVVCVLIGPFVSIVNTLYGLSNGDLPNIGDLVQGGEYEDYDKIMSDTILAAGRENVRRGISQVLREKFGIPYEECEVSADIVYDDENEEFSVNKVTLVLSGASIWRDPYEIEEYIEKLLGCECVTAIK